MDDSTLRTYMEELARAHMAWAKVVPNGSDAEIQQAFEELAEARRVLAQKKDRLDHLLGHPWRVGLPGSCTCNPEQSKDGERDGGMVIKGDVCWVYAGESQNSGGP